MGNIGEIKMSKSKRKKEQSVFPVAQIEWQELFKGWSDQEIADFFGVSSVEVKDGKEMFQ